ncbi:MAG: hypothetical protein C0501_16575 [Isosphaera sp.]|nr:hypothetical protein [Isosphaera sp.]
MLQDFRVAVRAAADLAAEVGLRFELGDPADDLLPALSARLAEVEGLAGTDPPPEARAELDRLLGLIRVAVGGGEDWLRRPFGLELASQHLRARVRRAYGLAAVRPTPSDPPPV